MEIPVLRLAWPLCPQRKCEAWSFAIGELSGSPWLVVHPQRKCEAWSFAMAGRSGPPI